MTIFSRCLFNQVRTFSISSIHKSSEGIRVRFAPSPTGNLHLGGLRTAFYNYIFARQNNGKFILRIEDTDTSRTVPGSAEEIERLLTWSGITPDESPGTPGDYAPYRQSERLDLYRKKADELVKLGRAYKCFCSPERLDLLRKFQSKNREKTRYDGKCKNLSPQEIEEKLAENQGRYVIRFSLDPGPVNFDDTVFGEITTDLVGSHEGDFIILKSDGFPTYHLANVIDDHTMKISHVMRGSEWIASTPKHIQLYQAFNWNAPKFAHFPLLALQGVKLSKRDNKSQVQSWIDAGYQPLALLNFLTNMGGGVPKEKQDSTELWSMDQFIREFKFNEMTRRLASLDLNILNRYNAKDLIKQWSDNKKDVLYKFRSAAASKDINIDISDEQLGVFLDSNIRRINTLNDLLTEDYFFMWACPKLTWAKETYLSRDWNLERLLKDVIQVLDSSDDIGDATRLLAGIRQISERNQVDYSQFMHFIRQSLTNRKTGLPVHEILLCLGRKKAIDYLNSALNYVTQ